MLPILGQCYEIRERLKELKCEWSQESESWFAPYDRHAEAQALADIENRRLWRDYLGTLPWVDGEFTATVWNAALRAASLFIPMGEAVGEIAGRVRAVKNVGDKWFARNVGRAYESAGSQQGATWRPDPATEKREKPVFRNELLEQVAAGHEGGFAEKVGMLWLANRSPIDPFAVTPADFLGALYEPHERVVVFEKFESQGQWLWSEAGGFAPDTVLTAALYEPRQRPMEQGGPEFEPTGKDGIWYLCNPVSGAWEWMEEVTSGDEPHWSRRFQDCVTSWRYMVLESDKARARDWIAMAVQMPLRIAAIYTSGGKSVHVLVRVDAKSKREWDELRDDIKPVMVTLGADQGCMSAVRLTRLPGCYREAKGKEQRLLYLNPAPDMTPIASRPMVRDVLGPTLQLAACLLATDPSEVDPEAAVTCALKLEAYGQWEMAQKVKAKLREVVA